MFSYVYMKILESQPRLYDRGVRWLSLGQSATVQRRIVDTLITRGTRLCDIGCGTGALAVLAARKGARVVGIDHAPHMLAVARTNVARAGLEDRVTLYEAGVAKIHRLSAASFDVVTATLVFSELSPDEQSFTLTGADRLLAPNGRLVIADEIKPPGFCKRAIYVVARIPLVAITFALTQTTTWPVVGIERRVSQAGFRIQEADRSRLESFLYLVAVKEGT